MQDLEKLRKTGKIKIGANIQSGITGAPWAWLDTQTQIILGFEVDIARAISDKLELSPEFIPLDGTRLIMGLSNEKCDLSIGALKPQHQMAGIVYSQPYYHLTQKLVAHRKDNIYDLVDLKGHTAGVLSGSLGEFIIEEENKSLATPISIKSYKDVLELFTDLQFNKISSAFIDSPVALWYSKSHIEEDLNVSDVAYKSGQYVIAMRKECHTLLEAINEALTNINKREIFDKYGLWDEAQENN